MLSRRVRLRTNRSAKRGDVDFEVMELEPCNISVSLRRSGTVDSGIGWNTKTTPIRRKRNCFTEIVDVGVVGGWLGIVFVAVFAGGYKSRGCGTGRVELERHVITPNTDRWFIVPEAVAASFSRLSRLPGF